MLSKEETKQLRLITQLDRLTQPFSWRDQQTCGVLITWLTENHVSITDFLWFVRYRVEMERLRSLEYFHPHPDVADAERIREIEKTVPDKIMRKFARRVRLDGTIYSNGTGG